MRRIRSWTTAATAISASPPATAPTTADAPFPAAVIDSRTTTTSVVSIAPAVKPPPNWTARSAKPEVGVPGGAGERARR